MDLGIFSGNLGGLVINPETEHCLFCQGLHDKGAKNGMKFRVCKILEIFFLIFELEIYFLKKSSFHPYSKRRHLENCLPFLKSENLRFQAENYDFGNTIIELQTELNNETSERKDLRKHIFLVKLLKIHF